MKIKSMTDGINGCKIKTVEICGIYRENVMSAESERHGKMMNFGERAAARKKLKDNRNEIKQLRKKILEAGCDKNTVNQNIKCFQETLELSNQLQADYEAARIHLTQALEVIAALLEMIGESEFDEVRNQFAVLISELEQVFHDCSIREDDMDFQSSLTCLQQMLETFTESSVSGMPAIMLRSELENLQSVLEDARGWSAPDYFGLAYYYLYADKNDLKEMENHQRNQLITDYVREHFLAEFSEECRKAGVIRQMEEKWPMLKFPDYL